MEYALSTLIRVLRVPLAVLSVVQNLLIVIVVLRYRTLKKNASNLLIAQLGFADFIFGMFGNFLLTKSLTAAFE